MALHIQRHPPQENLPETLERLETITDNQEIKKSTQMRVPTLKTDSRKTPDAPSIDRVAQSMIRNMVEQAMAEQTPAMIQKLRQELKSCEDQTLTHTTEVISQARKKFAASIEELVELNLIPQITPETIMEITHLLGETKESQSRRDKALLTLQNLQDAIALERQTDQLRQDHWDDSGYTAQEAIRALCELVSKYIPADAETAKQSSLQESETLLLHPKYSGDNKAAMASNKDTYLKNTPVYRAVLLFRAAKHDCDSLALCGTCPFRSKGEECRLWKQAFALHDIAFYRAQSVSQSQYKDTIAQKLTEAQIEISALRQQLLEEQTKSSDLQSKLDKITLGSKHLTSAHKKHGDDNYETELDPYLRFR